MKILLMILMLLVFSGCSSEVVWERVEDTQAEPVSAWQDQAYSIHMAVPVDAALLAETEGERLYCVDDGAYEVSSHVFLASSLDSAVHYLSGFRAERLTIIETVRFDLPEYQFAWYTQTEQGGRICQADLVMDGTRCYAVVTSVLESENRAYEDQCRQVFSTFGLYFDEGV